MLGRRGGGNKNCWRILSAYHFFLQPFNGASGLRDHRQCPARDSSCEKEREEGLVWLITCFSSNNLLTFPPSLAADLLDRY